MGYTNPLVYHSAWRIHHHLSVYHGQYIVLSQVAPCLVYLEYFVIFLKPQREHVSHTRYALSLLKAAGLILKLKKCAFLKNKINYSRHLIYLGWLAVSNHTIDSIRYLKVPTRQTEPRSHIFLCDVFAGLLRTSPRWRHHWQRNGASHWKTAFGNLIRKNWPLPGCYRRCLLRYQYWPYLVIEDNKLS